MKVVHTQFFVESNGRRVTYHNITEKVTEAIKTSGIDDGFCVITTPHTTCSIVLEEFVHDQDWNGDEFLQVDQNRLLEKMIPRQLTESDYLYPGPKHVQFLQGLAAANPDYPADPATILNADAHIKASLFGSSEFVIIKAGKPLIGSVGSLYYIDWDQNRKRQRTCNLMLMGE